MKKNSGKYVDMEKCLSMRGKEFSLLFLQFSLFSVILILFYVHLIQNMIKLGLTFNYVLNFQKTTQISAVSYCECSFPFFLLLLWHLLILYFTYSLIFGICYCSELMAHTKIKDKTMFMFKMLLMQNWKIIAGSTNDFFRWNTSEETSQNK